MSDLPQVGIHYTALGVPLLASHGIPSGVEYAITNVEGDKVSMQIYALHNKDAPDKITIYKECFGKCFRNSDPFRVVNKAGYALENHFYGPVNSTLLIFTSRMAVPKK